ncbi:apolipoprotein N-acyltransferase [Leeuwenhoekiella sp. A2]|uniref:apolipoprotein N-acyltransferase n=1 Tax=Leeuwenhoekiella sp. A2 TaxID=3141460 RepID=UPI003A80DD0A
MKNLLYALLSGFLLAISWPTYGFAFLILIAFVPLLFTEINIRNSTTSFMKVKVFGFAYLTFFIWNLFTTYWLYFSTPFGGAFAILVNSLLMALVFLFYHIVAKRSGFLVSVIFLTSIWMVFEKIHLSWDFSWPWLNLGNVFSEDTAWVQWYEYTGIFGGTLWVWITNLILFKTLLDYRKFKVKSILYWAAIKLFSVIGLPMLISYLIYENYQIPKEETEVLILQPNIDPYTAKYNTTDERIGEILLRLSREKLTKNTRALIAPETVFADGTPLSQIKSSEAEIVSSQLHNEYKNLSFIGGISLFERFSDPEKVGKQTNKIGKSDWFNDYNSAFLIKPDGESELYHKSKLVVGVENFPYPTILKPLLGDMMIDLGGTVAMKTTQPNRETFRLSDGTYTGSIICYESVYGEFVTGYVKNGAEFLTIITNDAWWGDTQGHKQHLSYAKLQAIETRRAVARSANTGISALINPRGDIKEELGYKVQGSILGTVALNREKTFYVEHGDYLARIAQFLAAIIFLFAIMRHKRNAKRYHSW